MPTSSAKPSVLSNRSASSSPVNGVWIDRLATAQMLRRVGGAGGSGRDGASGGSTYRGFSDGQQFSRTVAADFLALGLRCSAGWRGGRRRSRRLVSLPPGGHARRVRLEAPEIRGDLA